MAYDVFDYDSRHPKYGKSDERLLDDLYDELDYDTIYGDSGVALEDDIESWRDRMLDVIIEFNNSNGVWFDPQKTLSDYEDWKRKQKKV